MKNIKSLIVYGFLIWLIPFVASFFIFQLHETDRPLFETLMTVILTTTIMGVLIKYTKKNPIDSIQEGLLIGLIWLAINLFLDSFIFLWGPLKRPLSDYIKDIGLTYLIIPIITTLVSKINYPKNESVQNKTI
jgi:predicted membrane channel-forming protein YqfA (hemolysin III family)